MIAKSLLPLAITINGITRNTELKGKEPHNCICWSWKCIRDKPQVAQSAKLQGKSKPIIVTTLSFNGFEIPSGKCEKWPIYRTCEKTNAKDSGHQVF